ncbi:bifunctional aspartate kinase/homoserine dehydrogenase I [Halosquirtibacter laminarini]|uniref:Bifunctional aspartate kinase/homoserine dehydrogenase I n=1 Tax=Halosquirtibacter laminarini TaxID=3374600 RepID=A0AC61NPD0_9BACT|nr:bifunctional aspartate kinase/homoserine dehydrogenase I [Prolixibacteraceae bacterium]
MKVIKFGGVALKTTEQIKEVKHIVENNSGDLLVVVSAFDKVTDLIIEAGQNAVTTPNTFMETLNTITEIHLGFISDLEIVKVEIKEEVGQKMEELKSILQGVSLIGELTQKTLDRLMVFGEQLSSIILSAYLNIPHIASEKLIKTDNNFGKANVDFESSYRLIREAFVHFSGKAIAPGYIASTKKDTLTTLGRGGADFSAALFAAALGARELEVWTNQDGFMSADPNIINKAYAIPSMTYTEAMELSHFGAQVVYPPSLLPVYQMGIPLHLRNIHNTKGEGTRVDRGDHSKNISPVKGISSISNISLATIRGLGMVGVSGVSMRLFSAMAEENTSVIMISQASSENSISFAFDKNKKEEVKRAIHKEFNQEIASGSIHKILFEDDMSVVAIVGEQMKQTTGIAGKLFEALGRGGINTVAIAQGAGEQNISWVVRTPQLRKTLNVVHEAFFLSEYKQLNLFLIGMGTVGKDLLDQLNQQQEKLKKEHRLKIRLAGIANSRKMLFDSNGIPFDEYMTLLDRDGEASSLPSFAENVIGLNLYNSVFVDCTANDQVASLYKTFLENHVSVVAANKVAASSSYENYETLKSIALNKGAKFLFETNVGAGLPLISTINDLRKSGDKILKVQAVLSGTLNYIFNTISKDIPFSKTVRLAKEEGYAEPDPRIDLSGKDVQRKVVILARESGYRCEDTDITVEPFIPKTLFNGDVDSFWKALPGVDIDFENRRKILEKENKKWRFVGTFENGKGSCSLVEVDSQHPFYDLEGSNNIVLLTTERYKEYPMLIKGYGAGAAVTAAGVFADIIKIANI